MSERADTAEKAEVPRGGAFGRRRRRKSKRYLMSGETEAIKLAPGDYRTPANIVEFFRRYGIQLPKRDVDEINMLVPRNVPFNVSAT